MNTQEFCDYMRITPAGLKMRLLKEWKDIPKTKHGKENMYNRNEVLQYFERKFR